MKLLLALLGVSAMIGLCAPAYADPDDPSGDDAGFLSALKQVGIDYADPAHAITSAKAVCTCLGGGESGLELIHDVKSHNPGMDMEVASNFAMISAKFYCPQHLSKA
ncbi:MAG: DUF732 domain-containing protein [Mycobacterium sp.]